MNAIMPHRKVYKVGDTETRIVDEREEKVRRSVEESPFYIKLTKEDIDRLVKEGIAKDIKNPSK